MENQDIAKWLAEMAAYLEMAGVPFKPRAFERAAYAVSAFDEDVADLYRKEGEKALEEIPGVGAGIAERIAEYLTTGRVRDLERFRKRTPVDVAALVAVEGVGPKSVKVLYEKLRIRTLDDLARAARAGKIRSLPHFGEKSEAKILKGIEFLQKSGGRLPLGEALPVAQAIEQQLRALPAVARVAVAGSIRRRQETVGDLDFLAVSDKPRAITDAFAALPEVLHVYAKGATKALVRLKLGIDADLRVVPRESFGAALQYFTGDKRHNVALRQIAISQRYKLNEYGLFRKRRGKEGSWVRVAGKTEEEVYEKLGLQWVPPELRTASGEIEAARRGGLPTLIDYGDLRADLQVHTTWTDGADSLETMAEEAMRRGLEYIAITDHTRSLAMTKGADEKKLARQGKEIDRLNRTFRAARQNFRILKGAEVNIGKDGSLDLRDDALAALDVVGAAVHSHFGLSRSAQTARLVRVMRSPHVDILFHPTGRLINRREPIEIDLEEILKIAKETGTILEIDSYPDRLDLRDEYVRKAVTAGVRLSIDSDAHSRHHLKYTEFGIAQARRGWARKSDVVNTRPLDEFLSLLKGRSRARR